MEPAPTVFPSPDGRFILDIYEVEMRMSHTVECPYLYNAQTKECLFDGGSLWQASDIHWSDDSQNLTMVVACYPDGLHYFTLHLDIANDTATLASEEATLFTGTIKDTNKWMIEEYEMEEDD